MKIKKSIYIIYLALVLLPLAVTSAALPFLENTIPTHYGADFQADGFGSKYTVFIFPAIVFIIGTLMFGFSKLAVKFETNGNNNNERITMIFGIVILSVFNAMTYYFLYAFLVPVYDLSEMPINVNNFVFFAFGIGLVVMGNLMPKTRKNSYIGLRTKWSMKNETTWRKSQLFGGICLVLTGIVFVVLSIIGVILYWYFLVLLLAVAASVLYSYLIARKYA